MSVVEIKNTFGGETSVALFNPALLAHVQIVCEAGNWFRLEAEFQNAKPITWDFDTFEAASAALAAIAEACK